MTLARLARSGDLVKVSVPDEGGETMRDLTWAREDAVRARLKHTGAASWPAHKRYLASLKSPHPAFAEYLKAVEDCDERVARLTEALRAQAGQWRSRCWIADVRAQPHLHSGRQGSVRWFRAAISSAWRHGCCLVLIALPSRRSSGLRRSSLSLA
jgi:hypothetical protein